MRTPQSSSEYQNERLFRRLGSLYDYVVSHHLILPDLKAEKGMLSVVIAKT